MTDLPARVLAALDGAGRLGLAVSGGGDSMAMLHLAVAAGLRPDVVTVDHGLRPEAAAEAAMVGQVCAGYGLCHDTLHWQNWDHTGNLQNEARKARRRLMAEWAVARGLGAIALAHTQDDVAETFLMRLTRGAGVDGLAAMSPVWAEGGVTWVRPMLAMQRQDLRGWLTARGLAWAEDPSNENLMFDRIKMRKAMPALSVLGLQSARLAEVAQHLAEARVALDALADDWAERSLTEVAGTVLIHGDLWRAPLETQRRLLQRVILWIAPAAYSPRGGQASNLIQALTANRPATLAGCRFLSEPNGLRAVREAKAAARRVKASEMWDGRWRITGHLPTGAELGALGAGGLAQAPDWRAAGLPRAALLASPAVWHHGRLIAAPLAGFQASSYRAVPLHPLHGRNVNTLSH